MSDALRGFNQFSQDSGKKVRELRAAALGTFLPKLEEVTNFCRQYYAHIAWIYQNLWPEDYAFIQHMEDEEGSDNFEAFNPSEGRGINLHVTVSSRSLLPFDPDAAFSQLVELYTLGMKRTGQPLVPAEMVVEAATEIRDPGRAKKWLAQQQDETNMDAARQQALEQFRNFATQVMTVAPKSVEEEELFKGIAGLIDAMPELLKAPEMVALPVRVKEGIIDLLIRMLYPPQAKENLQPAGPQPAAPPSGAQPSQIQ
jgi:hypothetical protein